MEKKILEWITGCLGVVTILVCVCLYFLPIMKETWVLAAEKTQETILQDELVQIELEKDTEASSTVVEKKEQLNIELPDGIDGKDITIENDYMSQTISVRFARGVDNYSNNYKVKGSSNNIANLSYYRDGEAGVLEIALDKVCEYSYSFKEGFLCISLIDPHEIYDKIIVVDAGHGGRDPGAMKKGAEEKTLNLEIVLQLKALFDGAEDESIKVYYTRLEDDNPSLSERVNLANKANADIFISVHNNSSGSGKFNRENGTLVLYSPGDEEPYSSRRLAQLCLEHVNASAGSKRAGMTDGDYVYIVRNSKAPVTLIEVGYMTNKKELKNLQDPEYQKRVAQGIYDAIMQAFEEGF